ncbi:MAG TPA: hypothetical protein VFG84_02535 [Gemmatimonadaceae bacterium]|nr:hypothetical protein [Gemmatimonadaceae bacterium]
MPDDETQRFVLTPEQRSRLVPNIDIDALERFLWIAGKTDDERSALLQVFMQQPGHNTSFQVIGTTASNPTIEALLARIYAPMREACGGDAIANSESRLPGRELARAKLKAKEQTSTRARASLLVRRSMPPRTSPLTRYPASSWSAVIDLHLTSVGMGFESRRRESSSDRSTFPLRSRSCD